MPTEVSLISASLATVCIDSCLYGIFLTLFAISTYLLSTRKLKENKTPRRARSNGLMTLRYPLILLSYLIALTITAHWILTCTRLFQAFVHLQGGIEAIAFYADLTQRTEVVKTGFLVASMALGDSVIIYRLWIVWGYNKKIVIFPICTLAGLIVCGIGITYQFAIYKPGGSVFLSEAGRWITSESVFTLCTNVYSTAAMSWKIWRINSDAQKLGSRSLMSVVGTLVESAFIYAAWAVFFVATYHSQSNLQFIAIDCLPAVSGIAFMLINVRVGLGWAQSSAITSQVDSSQHVSFGRNPGLASSGDTYPMHPVAIDIQRAVDTEHKYDYANKTYKATE